MGSSDLKDKLSGQETDKKLEIINTGITTEGKLGHPSLKKAGYKTAIENPGFSTNRLTACLAMHEGEIEAVLLLVGDPGPRAKTIVAIEKRVAPGNRSASMIKDLLVDQPGLGPIDIVVLNPRKDTKDEMQPALVMEGDNHKLCSITAIENKPNVIKNTPKSIIIDNKTHRIPGGVTMIGANRVDAIKIGPAGQKPAVTVVRDALPAVL